MDVPSSFKVEVFPARDGDCLLMRCFSTVGATNILIDGGPRKTYAEQLANRLRDLRASNERLDLLVVSHIDTDHIGGIIELLKANGSAQSPAVIEIADIWHNGYRHLDMKGRLASPDEKRIVLGQVFNAYEAESGFGDISFKEGDTLARLIVTGGYPWNNAWAGEAVVAGNRTALRSGVTVTVLSPARQNLSELAYRWRKALQSMGVSFEAVECPEFDAAFEQFAAIDDKDPDDEATISAAIGFDPPDPATFREDASVTNGSSIALLVEWAGTRVLCLGDSWPGVIMQEWDKLPAEVQAGGVDVLKVSHHGSRRNSSPQMLSRIPANTYIVSTNASGHDHPDTGALLWIADHCPDGAMLLFNYPSSAANHIGHSDAKKRYGHQVFVGNGNAAISLEINNKVARVAQ